MISAEAKSVEAQPFRSVKAEDVLIAVVAIIRRLNDPDT